MKTEYSNFEEFLSAVKAGGGSTNVLFDMGEFGPTRYGRSVFGKPVRKVWVTATHGDHVFVASNEEPILDEALYARLREAGCRMNDDPTPTSQHAAEEPVEPAVEEVVEIDGAVYRITVYEPEEAFDIKDSMAAARAFLQELGATEYFLERGHWIGDDDDVSELSDADLQEGFVCDEVIEDKS